MFKKMLIAALAVVVGVGLVSGTRLGSHLRYKFAKVCEYAKEQVPLEAEIERLKMEVNNLSREDNRYFDQTARQSVQVEKLQQRVNKVKNDLVVRETYITSLRTALVNEGHFVVFNGGRVQKEPKQIESELRIEALKFMADEKILKADEENLKILKETLAANKAKVDGLLLKRKEMEAQLLVLEKELAQQRLKEQGKLVIEDGRYGQVSKDIEELKERFELRKQKNELRNQAEQGTIRAELEKQVEAQKLDKAIEERFGKLEASKPVAE
jgi:outer membrane murein-binding lipoprotein Lpp